MRRNSLLCCGLFCAFCCVFQPADSSVRAAAAANSPERPPSAAVYGGQPAFAPGAITVLPAGALKERADRELDDYDDDPRGGDVIADPFEPWNRFWFRFNDIFYLYVAKPVYRGYVAVTPHQLRNGMRNFFSNLLFPVRFVNNILQFRFMEAGVEFGRFFINSVSSLGFVNVAKDKKTIVPVDPRGEDFGRTLGHWGIGHGLYIVWPFIGPSSPRDTLGRIGDMFLEPLFYVSPWELASASAGYLRFNALDEVLPLYEDLRDAAVDPYIAMRQAYINYRRVRADR
jgi:phospholipid-binding lipoprotein MlaA